MMQASARHSTPSSPVARRGTTLPLVSAVALAEMRRPAGIPALSDLDLIELNALYDAMDAASEAYLGIINQPRCQDGEDLIQAAVDRCSETMDAIFEEAKTRHPADDWENRARVAILIKRALHHETFDDALVACADAIAGSGKGLLG